MNGYCWRNQKGRKFDISDNEFWIIFDLEIANFALFFSVTIIRQQYHERILLAKSERPQI